MAYPPEIQQRLKRLNIRAKDLQESFSRSGGPGGQHANKTSTAVTLSHPKSNTQITVSDSRSQATNRQLALERLLQSLEQQKQERRQEQQAEASRNRARKNRRSLGQKRRMVQSKRRRSQTKKNRKPPRQDD